MESTGIGLVPQGEDPALSQREQGRTDQVRTDQGRTGQTEQITAILPQRDVRGRFKSRGMQSTRRFRRGENQRVHLKQRSTLKKHIFEEYLHAFCLPGDADDTLPTSKSASPLVAILEHVIKKTHLLGRTERSRRMREFFSDRFHSNGTRSSNESAAPSKRSKRFKGCRLPLVSRRATEMKRVETWLQMAFHENALMYSVSDAFTLCKLLISQHDASKKAPNPPASIEGSCSGCAARENLSDLCSDCVSWLEERTESAERESLESATVRPEMIAESAVKSTANGLSETQPSATVAVTSESDEEMKKKMDSLQKSSSNDINFLMLYALFDTERDCAFGLFSGNILELCRTENRDLTNLMKEVLLYAHWERWGVKDREQHDLRRKRLKATLELFKAARAAAGLKSYEELQWSFTS